MSRVAKDQDRHNAALPETGFVRLSGVLAVYPVGRSTWWAGVKSGKYPASHKISPRCTAWRAEDIRSLLDSLIQDAGQRAAIEHAGQANAHDAAR